MLKMGAYIGAMLAVVTLTSAAGAQPPVPPSPKDFVMGASQSDLYEIAAATVAITQSRDPQVVSFAQMMVRDHTRMTQDLRTAALASGLPPPDPGMSSDQASMLNALQSLRGTEFDKAYLRQQILAHTQALAVETSFATAGSDANLQKAAAAALPTIKSHLKMVQQLASKIGSP